MKDFRLRLVLFAVIALCMFIMAGCSGTCPQLGIRSPVTLSYESPNGFALAAPVQTAYAAPAVCAPEPLYSVKRSYQLEK